MLSSRARNSMYLSGSLRPGQPVDADMETGHGDGGMNPAPVHVPFGFSAQVCPTVGLLCGFKQ